ncbi:ribonuclease BN [Streptomyces xanthochromogenes]|uniref:ribonuclease BN n=1 Tax=Streptomyces xanthochromogenes TaxID=67384 RepID=UPI00343B5BB3
MSVMERSPTASCLGRTLRNSTAWHGWKRAKGLELGQRALGFAAVGFLTLVPLLIVVSAADPGQGRGFAQWLGAGLGVSAPARERIGQLFAQPTQTVCTTTAFGLATLAAFGVTFGAAVQTGYEKIWDLNPARWHARWRHVLWLGVLVGYLYLSATAALWHSSWAATTGAALSTVLFFWWSQRVLLSGRIAWRALLPGAVATVAGLYGLRVFSRLVFSPLIASSAVAHGPVGTVLVIQSRLVGVGVVVLGGALVGRLLDEQLGRPGTAGTVRQGLPAYGDKALNSPSNGWS